MTKYLIAGLALLLALAGGGLWLQNKQLAELNTKLGAQAVTIATQAEAIKQAAHADDVAREATRKRIAAEKALADIKKERQRALESTLKADPAWADQPLPDGIADWVRNSAARGARP